MSTYRSVLPVRTTCAARNRRCASLCQIREDWKYVAMVIDRLQLYLFFVVTTIGTIAILLADAPHIFEYVDQDKVMKMHRAKSP